MIVAKTPLRIPIAGGLTDLKSYAAEFGGVTVSATIDKYIYVILRGDNGNYFDLKYQNVHERVTSADQISHALIREATKLTGLQDRPFELVIMSDLQGESGLGGSGALTVSLLNAMYAYKGERVDKMRLLREAAHIEVDILEGASGYHDPTICALGGLKLVEYDGPAISYRDVAIDDETRRVFEESLMFFYSGRHAKSKPSLDLLSSHMDRALPILHEVRGLGYEAEQAFLSGDLNRIGRVMAEQQAAKMKLPGRFVDGYVRRITKQITNLGGYAQLPGGKISAFVLVCCPPEKQDAIRASLSSYPELKLKLESGGAQVRRM